MHRTRSVAALAIVLGVATGCDTTGGVEHQEVGELIATFSEGDPGREWVGQVNLPEAVVLGSDVDIEDWVGTLPGADPAEFGELDQVDLTEHFLVIGGYHRCTETSAILMIPVGEETRAVFNVTSPDPDTVCEWSPYTLDVWAVPLSLTDGTIPTSVPITRGSEFSSVQDPPSTIGVLLGAWDESATDREALEALVTRFQGPVTDRGDLDELASALAGLGDSGSEADAVREVDPGAAFLLLTGYPSCTERSLVMADLGADPTRVWIEIEADADVDCAWAPYTLDVWQIGQSEVGDYLYIDDLS